MMDEIDPLIRQEFDRLGLNIVENADLADLIIGRVNRARYRRYAMIFIAVLSGALLVFVAALGITKIGNTTSSGITPASNSLTQPAGSDGSLALPQAGYVEIDGSKPSKSKVSYLFALKQGWILQEVTDNRDPIQSDAGVVEIYKVAAGSPDQFVQKHQMSSGTQINEFGVPQTGLYRFVFTFTNTTYKGSVRIAFVRSK